MSTPGFIVPLALATLVAAAAASPAHAQEPDTTVVAEARTFMEGYGRDLGSGNREGIASRYDRRGAYMMFNGERELAPWEQLVQQYRTSWRPPAAFAWRDLVFEPAGPDAAVVNGYFLWTLQPGAEPLRFRYTALLVRQEGELRIRLEDESVVPAGESSQPAAAPPGATLPPATP